MGSFSDKVFDAVKQIPRGYVTTYGDIARVIGSPRSARYVGWALRNNPSPSTTATPEEAIPCHRVVFKDGQICDNFAFGGVEVQRRMLQDEGVIFTDNMHVDMNRCHFAFVTDTLGRPTDIDWIVEFGED